MSNVKTLKSLEEEFKIAIETKAKFIAVKIQTEASTDAEIIINPNANFPKKLEYYKKAYNEDLTLKAFNGIKITDFTHSESFDCIQYDLLHK